MIPQGQLKTEVRFKPFFGKCSQIQHATIQASTKNQNLGGFLVNSVVYFKKNPARSVGFQRFCFLSLEITC